MADTWRLRISEGFCPRPGHGPLIEEPGPVIDFDPSSIRLTIGEPAWEDVGVVSGQTYVRALPDRIVPPRPRDWCATCEAHWAMGNGELSVTVTRAFTTVGTIQTWQLENNPDADRVIEEILGKLCAV